MKAIDLKITVILILASVLIAACSKDDEDDETNTNTNIPVQDVIKNYSGSGSEGDLITFEVNTTAQTYVVDNETTGSSDSGSYTVKTGNFSNIYEVDDGSSKFFAVELADKMFAANFPTGNSANDISYGVSSTLSYLNNTSNIEGDYTWIIISDNYVDYSTDNKEWGVMTVSSDGTWIKKDYKGGSGSAYYTGYLSPNDFTGPLPVTSGDESGTWEVDTANQERLKVTVNGSSDELTGYVYGDGTSAAFVLDLGTGNGFLLGLKNTNAQLSDIAGTYNFIDVWDGGYKGAGKYIIDNNGGVTYNHISDDGTTSSGSFTLSQCSVLKNTYYCDNASIDSDSYSVYCVVCGDLIMHFIFSNSNDGFVSYGAGGKI